MTQPVKRFNKGDKVSWSMPMDIYEGIVVSQNGNDVEVRLIVGPNDETHPVPTTRPAEFLNLVRAAIRETKP